MSPEQLASLTDDVRYIRERVDDHGQQLADLRVSVEHRLTRVEVKSGIWGLLGGLLSGLGIHLKNGQ